MPGAPCQRSKSAGAQQDPLQHLHAVNTHPAHSNQAHQSHYSPRNAGHTHQATDCMPSTSAHCRTETRTKDKPLNHICSNKPTQVRPALTNHQLSLCSSHCICRRMNALHAPHPARTRLFTKQVYMHHPKHTASRRSLQPQWQQTWTKLLHTMPHSTAWHSTADVCIDGATLLSPLD
jgi:hypothetical protein